MYTYCTKLKLTIRSRSNLFYNTCCDSPQIKNGSLHLRHNQFAVQLALAWHSLPATETKRSVAYRAILKK